MAQDSLVMEVDRMASFEGGQQAMNEYLSNMIRLPEAGDSSNGGTVIVQFIIDEKGKVTEVEVIEKLNAYYNKEAMRVIGEMPRWLPALRDGKPVPVVFTLPIVFPPSDG